MAKHDALRTFLTSALPELARNPDRLMMYMTGGNLVARYGENLGFEYRATLQIDLLGFPGEPAAFFLPLIVWLKRYEPAALQNHETGERALRFEIDPLDNGSVDISMQLPISEAVDVVPLTDGAGHEMTLREEPPVIGEEMLVDPAALLKRIWHDGVLIVGYPIEEE